METTKETTTFEKDTLIAKSRKDIVAFLTLEHWHIVIQSMKTYYYETLLNQDNHIPTITLKTQIRTLFERVWVQLQDELKTEEDFKKIQELCFSDDIDNVIEGFRELEKIFLKWGITSMGWKQSFNPMNANEEDDFFGN